MNRSLQSSLAFGFVVAGLASVAAAQVPPHRILSRFQSAHAHSVPGPMVSTPDGSILFVAEAGVLATIDADDPASYAGTTRIVPISSYGVRGRAPPRSRG